MMRFFEVSDPYWFVGKDLGMLRRLMFLMSVADAASLSHPEHGDFSKMSDSQRELMGLIDEMREEDEFYHG